MKGSAGHLNFASGEAVEPRSQGYINHPQEASIMNHAYQESDFGTPETQLRGGGVRIGYTEENEKVAIVKIQNHFDELFARHIIDHQQHSAGKFLQCEAEKAGQFSYIKSSADFDVKGNCKEYAVDVLLDARVTYNNSLAILDDKGFRGISERLVIECIVIDDGYLTNFTKNAGKLRRVRGLLHSGLDKLIKHYGI